MEVDCDVLDGTKSSEDMSEVATRFDVLEGLIMGAESEDEIDSEDTFDIDETLTDVMRANKVEREILEVKWQAKSLEVMEKESEIKEMAERVCDNSIQFMTAA